MLSCAIASSVPLNSVPTSPEGYEGGDISLFSDRGLLYIGDFYFTDSMIDDYYGVNYDYGYVIKPYVEVNMHYDLYFEKSKYQYQENTFDGYFAHLISVNFNYGGHYIELDVANAEFNLPVYFDVTNYNINMFDVFTDLYRGAFGLSYNENSICDFRFLKDALSIKVSSQIDDVAYYIYNKNNTRLAELSTYVYFWESDFNRLTYADLGTIKMQQFLENVTYSVVPNFINGAEENYNRGYSTGYQNGYGNGYNAGQNADETITTIFNGIFGVALLPINMFLTMLNFDVMGINVAGIVTALLTVALIIIVVRFVTGEKVSGDD